MVQRLCHVAADPLTYAHVCYSRMLTYADVWYSGFVTSLRIPSAVAPDDVGAVMLNATGLLSLLFSRMLTYAHLCSPMLTHAHLC
jgi:hypothetical protein